jgi:hypothetical protein
MASIWSVNSNDIYTMLAYGVINLLHYNIYQPIIGRLHNSLYHLLTDYCCSSSNTRLTAYQWHNKRIHNYKQQTLTYQTVKRSNILAFLSCQTRAEIHSHRPFYKGHVTNVCRQLTDRLWYDDMGMHYPCCMLSWGRMYI